MNAARFNCYLTGGTPDGAQLGFPGCRDRQPLHAAREFAGLPGAAGAWTPEAVAAVLTADG